MKTKAKTKDVVRLHFTEEGLQSWEDTQKPISARARKMIIEEAKSTAKHFDGHNWDLALDSLLGQLKVDLLGFNPEWLFLKTLVQNMKGKTLYIHHRDHSVISLKKHDPKQKAIGTITVGGKKAKPKAIKKKVKRGKI